MSAKSVPLVLLLVAVASAAFYDYRIKKHSEMNYLRAIKRARENALLNGAIIPVAETKLGVARTKVDPKGIRHPCYFSPVQCLLTMPEDKIGSFVDVHSALHTSPQMRTLYENINTDTYRNTMRFNGDNYASRPRRTYVNLQALRQAESE